MKRWLMLLTALLLMLGTALGEVEAASCNAAEENVKEAAVMTIRINEQSFTVTLEENDTARALAERLPLTLTLRELNGNEKFADLEEPLPTAATDVGAIEAGDVMLYGNDCLVVFYESFPTRYRYTRIGRIADVTGLADTLGKGSVTLTFE